MYVASTAIIAISAAGLFAFLNLGRAKDPTFTVKTLTFVTAWPGTTAHEVQDQIAEPLAKRMQELRWYDRIETFTRPGLAFGAVTLKDPTLPVELQEEFYQAQEARQSPIAFVSDRRASCCR